jgi:hypothetical protein
MGQNSITHDDGYVIDKRLCLTLGDAVKHCHKIYDIRDWRITVLISQSKKDDTLGVLKSLHPEYREGVIVLYPRAHEACWRKNNTMLSTLHHEFGEVVAHIHLSWLSKNTINSDCFDKYRDALADHMGRIGYRAHLKMISDAE